MEGKEIHYVTKSDRTLLQLSTRINQKTLQGNEIKGKLKVILLDSVIKFKQFKGKKMSNLNNYIFFCIQLIYASIAVEMKMEKSYVHLIQGF